MRQLFEAAVSWSYDSPAKGGLHHAHYPGRVANKIVLLKWTSRAAAPVFAIMLCASILPAQPPLKVRYHALTAFPVSAFM